MEATRQILTLWHLSGRRSGQAQRVEGDRVAIGRGGGNDVAFDPHSERSVSHRHCEIRRESDRSVLYDIGSLNGTFVNGERIHRHILADGDEIGLGREGPRLRVGLGTTPPSGAMGPIAAPDLEMVRIPTRASPRSRVRRVRTLRAVPLAIAALAIGVVVAIALAESPLRRAAPSPPAAQAPAHGTWPEGPTLLVHGVVFDQRTGAVIVRRELGVAALCRTNTALTTRSVIDQARSFLERSREGPAAARLEVVTGDGQHGAEVNGYWLNDDARRPESLLGALQLAAPGLPDRRIPLLATEAEGPLSWHPPAQLPQTTEIAFQAGFDGFRVAQGDAAVLLRLGRSPESAGTPLFDSEGALAGITLGPARPQEALGPAVIRAFTELLVPSTMRKW